MFYFNVDKEASASASGDFGRPPDPHHGSAPGSGSHWGTSVSAMFLQPRRQIDAYAVNSVEPIHEVTVRRARLLLDGWQTISICNQPPGPTQLPTFSERQSLLTK